MPDTAPIVITHPIDSDICIIQVEPGQAPSQEPLLADAGLACELRGQIWVAMNGLSGLSENVRQLLTSINNDLTEDVLQLLAAELSDPIRRHSSIPIQCRQRADQIKTVFNENSMDLRSVLALVEDATSENDINNMPSP